MLDGTADSAALAFTGIRDDSCARRRRFSALDEAAREHWLRAVERFFPLWGTVMSLLRPVTLLCYFDCFPLNPDRAA